MKIKGALNAAAFRTSRRMQTGATGPAERTDSAPLEKKGEKSENSKFYFKSILRYFNRIFGQKQNASS